MLAVTPIDLATALGMVDVRNPQFLEAQSRVLEAVALRQLAASQYLPTINYGTSYDGHTGNLQQSNGNILSVKRNSLTVGAGVNAIAAGTVNIPGLVWNENLSLILFDYLRSRQLVSQRQFDTAATQRRGTASHSGLSRLAEAEGRRAIHSRPIIRPPNWPESRRTSPARGKGGPADADRARTEQLDREALVVEAEGQAVISSARLAQLIAVIRRSGCTRPTIGWPPTTWCPPPSRSRQLLALALIQRPELGARQAAVRQALYSLNQQKLLPFSPTVFLGFSTDEFGGGSNLVAQPVGAGPFARGEPRFGAFSPRTDFDAMAYFTLKNVGLGNRAAVAAAASRLRQSDWERLAEARAGADGSCQRIHNDPSPLGSDTHRGAGCGRFPRFLDRRPDAHPRQRRIAARGRR